MTTPVVRLKRSAVSGKAPLPSDLSFGEIAINYADGVLYYKKPDGSVAPLSSGGSSGTSILGNRTKDEYIVLVTGQTEFNIPNGYNQGFIDVVLNGVLLNNADYTATDGSTVSLAQPTVADDVVIFLTYTKVSGGNRTVSEVLTTTNGQTQFTVPNGYDVGYLDITLNGVFLSSYDYTAINGSTVTLTDPTLTDDYIRFIKYSNPGVNSEGDRAVYEVSVSATQSDFVLPNKYAPGYLDVAMNGIVLGSIDYVASDGINITLVDPAISGDILRFTAYDPGMKVDTYRKAEVNALINDMAITMAIALG